MFASRSRRAAFTVIVNTSDGYHDCWRPFFTLFDKYWADNNAPVLLNTESVDWADSRVEIRCAKTGRATPGLKPSWSERLIACLDQVETPLVLYMQEDYFLESPVNDELVRSFADLMLRDSEVRHIGLTHFGSCGPFTPTADERLWQIAQRARYRISTQAGLWHVPTLRSHLRAGEDVWMFEIYGTRRAWRRPELFLTANRSVFAPPSNPIIQYTHTGIIQGKWHLAMPRLFEDHGIKVDFSKRGFFHAGPGLVQRYQIAKRLMTRPRLAARGLLGL